MQLNEYPLSQNIERLLQVERPRLVRWCARLVGDVDVAEDLVQETLSTAWSSKHCPAQEDEYLPWLMGIARNICRSWLRHRRRELAHHIERFSSHNESASDGTTMAFADPFDHEMELEREELAQLIDHAMALLPKEARAVLIAKYIDEYSLREIAERLRITESALAARLHRGKTALRRVLTTHLREEMASYGFVNVEEGAWQQTRIWCPDCGQHRLIGQLNNVMGTFRLRCPGCFARVPIDLVHWHDLQLFGN
ncbi:MAG TPA: RNA polymerase sigma factor, partial [Ktedonobacterales bacterium]|nr:RNA polymerase sigma factor [Ktedonobacterales bacterium]